MDDFDIIVLVKIFLTLSSIDVIKFCSVNKRFNNVCGQYRDYIWSVKLKYDYPNVPIIGDPMTQYIKLEENIGLKYYATGKYLRKDGMSLKLGTDENNPTNLIINGNKVTINISGNELPKGTVIYLANYEIQDDNLDLIVKSRHFETIEAAQNFLFNDVEQLIIGDSKTDDYIKEGIEEKVFHGKENYLNMIKNQQLNTSVRVFKNFENIYDTELWKAIIV